MVTVHDVVIVGSGPAGYTAAIYTARAGLKPIVFAGSLAAGGALMNTTEVENYPGFPAGIDGPDLMEAMREQAEKFGADIRYEDVTGVQLDGPVKTVVSEGGESLQARAVILATGSAHRKLGVPGEEEFSGRGVSYCATCDGFFFRDQHIVVVGGGDSALEEAMFLTRFASKVTLVHRRGELRASKIMQERALANEKIEFAWHSTVAEVRGEAGGSMTGLVLNDVRTGEQRELAAGAMFVAIGHDPRVELVAGQVELDGEGYIKVADPSTRTNLAGVFACGDVVDHSYRQAITAAGTGCRAALDAERYLAALEG
ncbi:thioredoxin-disulfide reductase [Buchananella felis]|uniref:thioredoxin-disulfide reductase n=1 Tax=Buchananella felis TaxID=3231492 RepID=UPI00352761C9